MIEVRAFVVGMLATNCYLVFSETTKKGFLIDPGGFDRKIAGAIGKEAVLIKNIINTHGHRDHTAGNKKFGYPVLIHERDSDFPGGGLKNTKLLKDADTIEEGDIKFEVIHTPGHTPGSISLKLGNMIFTGDTLFREGVGRTDFPYGSETDLSSSIKKRLMIFDDSVEIFPGHGPASTIGHERKHNPFLTEF